MQHDLERLGFGRRWGMPWTSTVVFKRDPFRSSAAVTDCDRPRTLRPILLRADVASRSSYGRQTLNAGQRLGPAQPTIARSADNARLGYARRPVVAGK